MDNGIYISLSRQMGLFREMEVVANNLANVNTTGYTGEKMMFDDYLVKGGQGPKQAYTNDLATYRDTTQGRLEVTENALDMAVSGEGYFVIQTPLGERYTRAGNFQIDVNGVLVTDQGNPVRTVGGGQLVFEPEDTDIEIREDGLVVVNGEERGQLEVVEFANRQFLVPVGNTMFKADAAPMPAQNSRVLHGVLERSNVDPIMEMTRMLTVSRSVGSTAKLIDAQYELQRKASNAWAKVE